MSVTIDIQLRRANKNYFEGVSEYFMIEKQ